MLLIKDKEVEFMGDSNLRRFTTKILGRPSFLMKDKETKKIKKYYQLAIGGQTTSQLLKKVHRCKFTCYKLRQRVIILCGSNDISRNYGYYHIKTNFIRMIHNLKKLGVLLINLCTIPHSKKNSPGQENIRKKVNNFLRKLQDSRVTVRDLDEIGENLLERDGIHLNLDGLRLLGDILKR